MPWFAVFKIVLKNFYEMSEGTLGEVQRGQKIHSGSKV